MHSTNTSLRITPIPAFTDNYIWVIVLDGLAWVVDPGDATVVEQYLHQHQLSLAGILLTHHHADHTGGALALQTHWRCDVFAPDSSHPAYQTLDCHRVVEGETLTLQTHTLIAQVIALPGHTLDHIAFYLNAQHLFCGDVLFGGGCGRLFEGTPAQMFASLARIKQLPVDTLIYPAHEYTAHNLAFASLVEPDNHALQMRIVDTQQRRTAQQATLPTTLALELATNPFLRCETLMHTPQHLSDTSLAVFTSLRQARNQF